MILYVVIFEKFIFSVSLDDESLCRQDAVVAYHLGDNDLVLVQGQIKEKEYAVN